MDRLEAPVLRLSGTQFVANIAAVQQRISDSELMLVMKDDAYGHGIAWATRHAVASGVRWFGSYDIATGVEIRQISGPEPRIFAWVTSEDAEIEAALSGNIDVGVGAAHYLARIIALAGRTGIRARVHLKIDTGLHRNGFLPHEWEDAVRLARQAEAAGLVELCGIWSHLAEASDAEDDEAQRLFFSAANQLGPVPYQHLTASAASWWRPELRGNLSRIGAFCYGIRSAQGPELEAILPAATLEATVIGVDGEDVAVNVGSFDGVPSVLAGAHVGTPAGPRRLRRIDASTSLVDAWPEARAGQVVSIFGPGTQGEASATTLAESIDTVGEEILTRLSSRVRRVGH